MNVSPSPTAVTRVPRPSGRAATADIRDTCGPEERRQLRECVALLSRLTAHLAGK
ncbi:hypothetical protein [Streptomyces rimosus]|uniref:hypothetical protein n=1 Tax=Streptomyces rimosus TaxID=1927 RepID=UPI001F18A51E|nr:hypothetical protein [Streptomyces rimosus]